MRIVIADDERLARFNLSYLLHELLPGAEVIEVTDGVELVEAVLRHRPELVLADIGMPRLDGLTAIEQLAGRAPGTRFVVVTAHADFEYARRGIGLRVTDYLLKPVDPEQLAAVIGHAARELAETAQRWSAALRADLANQLQDAAAGRVPPAAERAEADPADHLAAIAWVDVAPGDAGPDVRAVLEEVCAGCGPQRPYATIGLGGTAAALLVRLIRGDRSRVVAELGRRCGELTGPRVMVSALWSHGDSPRTALAAVTPSFARPALRFSGRPGAAWPAPDWLAAPADPRVGFITDLAHTLEAAAAGDEVRCRATAARLRERRPRLPDGLFLGDLARFVTIALGKPVPATSPAAMLDAVIAIASAGVPSPEPRAGSRISRIQDYIAQHYDRPLSLSGIANRFDMSPNYLSTLFHERTGMTFVQYLTEVRVANAKKILRAAPETSIKQVAGMVGFGSARHFSQVFLRHTGQLPSDFARATSPEQPPATAELRRVD